MSSFKGAGPERDTALVYIWQPVVGIYYYIEGSVDLSMCLVYEIQEQNFDYPINFIRYRWVTVRVLLVRRRIHTKHFGGAEKKMRGIEETDKEVE